MARQANSKGHGRPRRSRKLRRARFKWPRAFRIVPVRVTGKPKAHAHLLGQAGEPPCPPNTTFNTYTTIGSVRYCVYLDEKGLPFMLQC